MVNSFGGISITETISPTWKLRNEIFSHCDFKALSGLKKKCLLYWAGNIKSFKINSASSCLLKYAHLNLSLYYERYRVDILFVHRKKMLDNS